MRDNPVFLREDASTAYYEEQGKWKQRIREARRAEEEEQEAKALAAGETPKTPASEQKRKRQGPAQIKGLPN
ncbi:hypothetical protein LTS18_000093 [Coniosporium uncinatum]|uniref:Uncharacterized protein n=1 Tax=Coniosporium uncinatum TaxID=93489 RepID=A0ACC3DZI1_9PEZI|nr:hypothetical protein LTS18_000093 [Coniosporium uncinatum]